MRSILLLVFALQFVKSAAQKPAGLFGSRHAFGVSVDVGIFKLSRFTGKRMLVPTLVYTRVVTRRIAAQFEFGMFNINVKGNSEHSDGKLKVDPDYYVDLIATGRGTVRGTVLGAYRTTFWQGFAPVGTYHSWGAHAALLQYKSDNFTYRSEDYMGNVMDTSFSGKYKPSRLVVSLSISLGRKLELLKSKRLVWDYGIRCKVPIGGFYTEYAQFYNGRDYQLFNGVKSYIGSSFQMFYTGLHFAF